MSKEMVISANRHETKVAILEEDQLVEIFFQRANEYSLAGSIHKGRVTRVLPGMQSAFVDLGLERDTFLYVSDFFEENEEYDRILPAKEDRPARPERTERPERPERVERPERIERPERTAPEPVLASSPVSEPVEPEAEPEEPESPSEVLEASQTAPRTTANLNSPSERREDAEERERRGRRSRRRRNRGRGFPDSKYSSDASEPPKMELQEPAPAPASASVGDFEFPVLPGESLAKYRRTPSEAEPEDEELATSAEPPFDPEPEQEPDPNPEPEPKPEPIFAAPVPAAHDEKSGHEPVPIAETAHPETPVQNDPLSEYPGDEISHFGSISGAAVAKEPVDSEPRLEPEPESPRLSKRELEAQADAVSELITEDRKGPFALDDVADTLVPTIELIEAEEIELSSVPDEEDARTESDESVEPDDENGEPATPDIAAADNSPQQTAAVREQSGRYMHRMPRRSRRRQRGSGPTENAPPAAPLSESAPALYTAPAPPRAEPPPARPGGRQERVVPSITELLKEGQEILVQIAKEPLGQKGARITSHIALPGRYVVYMPTLEHMGVSRKIASDEERLRLKKILLAHRSDIQGGFIVRTAGEGKSEEEISADMSFLGNLWLDIRQKAERKPAPLLLHHDLDIVQRILRDQVTDQFKSIWVDNEEAYESILRFVQRFQPAMVSRVKLYTRNAPIFDAFNITAELEKALRPKVWLKSGGYIVINQTEALVAVDVNTGKYVGKSNRLEDTIVKTNTEAVKEIVRQIRLRDLGGIIVVDFIDMDERKNRQKVMQALEECMRADKAPYKILQFNDFGLVAITRKRVKQSLERALCSPCPYCEGAGYVKSVQTTVSEILQEAHKIARAVEGKDVLLRVHPEVAKYLKSSQNKYLEEMEEVLRRPVLVKGDALLHQDKFDLA